MMIDYMVITDLFRDDSSSYSLYKLPYDTIHLPSADFSPIVDIKHPLTAGNYFFYCAWSAIIEERFLT